MSQPHVVAMVPTWNGAAHLRETLDSLAAQDHQELSFLISDDASTDDTLMIAREYEARDARFHVVSHAVRRGWIGNCNWLLSAVTSDFAFIAPQDDVFEPTYVSRLVAALEQRPDAALAYCTTVEFDGRGRSDVRDARYPAHPGTRMRRGLRYLFMQHDHGRSIPFRGVARVDALRAAGPLRLARGIEFGVDVRWLMRLNLLGPFVRVAEPLCAKRVYERGEPHAGVARKHASTRTGNIRLRWLQQRAFAAEVCRARLPLFEATVLLAAIAGRGVVLSLPRRLRVPAERALERRFVE